MHTEFPDDVRLHDAGLEYAATGGNPGHAALADLGTRARSDKIAPPNGWSPNVASAAATSLHALDHPRVELDARAETLLA